MGVEADVEIALDDRRERILPHRWQAVGQGRRDRLGLVGAHQRAAARIAENDDLLDAGLLLEPFHADADVEHRMFEQELVLDPAIARVPAEKAEALDRKSTRLNPVTNAHLV